MFLPELLCLPTLFEVQDDAHCGEQIVQVLFANLDRAKGRIPRAVLTFACRGIHLFNDHICQRQNGLQMSHDSRFRLPSASRRWRNAARTSEPVLAATGASPFAEPTCSTHGPTDLDGFLDMIRSLHHQIEHRITCANHTEAFPL